MAGSKINLLYCIIQTIQCDRLVNNTHVSYCMQMRCALSTVSARVKMQTIALQHFTDAWDDRSLLAIKQLIYITNRRRNTDCWSKARLEMSNIWMIAKSIASAHNFHIKQFSRGDQLIFSLGFPNIYIDSYRPFFSVAPPYYYYYDYYVTNNAQATIFL